MNDRDGRKQERFIAWGLVAGMHLGLFWLLTTAPVARRADSAPVRMRLVFLPAPVAVVPVADTRAPRPRPQVRMSAPPESSIQATLPAPPMPAAVVQLPAEQAVDWQQQARDVVRLQPAPDSPTFAPDPLRSRGARLPGGEHRARFAMREPATPAAVAGFIGALFGGYPPPCPRVRENIAGLLTSTSDRDRALLQEELRQQREYCSP